MNKVFMFDVDGTLTPSRQQMTDKFLNTCLYSTNLCNFRMCISARCAIVLITQILLFSF